jgi:hypothetical protein
MLFVGGASPATLYVSRMVLHRDDVDVLRCDAFELVPAHESYRLHRAGRSKFFDRTGVGALRPIGYVMAEDEALAVDRPHVVRPISRAVAANLVPIAQVAERLGTRAFSHSPLATAEVLEAWSEGRFLVPSAVIGSTSVPDPAWLGGLYLASAAPLVTPFVLPVAEHVVAGGSAGGAVVMREFQIVRGLQGGFELEGGGWRRVRMVDWPEHERIAGALDRASLPSVASPYFPVSTELVEGLAVYLGERGAFGDFALSTGADGVTLADLRMHMDRLHSGDPYFGSGDRGAARFEP